MPEAKNRARARARARIIIGFSSLLLAVSLNAQPPSDSVKLKVEPQYFSPNDDGIQDQIFFSPILRSQKDVSRWRLVIRNDNGKTIRKLTGAGFSALIKWDGFDKKDRLVEDGKYNAVFTAWGRKLKISSPPKAFVVDTSPALVEVQVSTTILQPTMLDKDFLTFSPKFIDESPIDRWQLQILDLTGRTVYVHWSTSPVSNIIWDGKDQTTGVMAPQGNYRCTLQAWDKAGNESKPSFIDITVNVTARDMLQQALNLIGIVETDLGLIVQLNAEDIFNEKRKRVRLTLQGKEVLREVALLVNAYPFASVRLDGYSHKGKKSSKDRHRSSLYAWRAYSFLVKKCNVKASRLLVKGRGRSPMFDRRSVPLPIVKNGIEIRLEGLDEW